MNDKQEIKLEDIFNDEKRQGVKELIDASKQMYTEEDMKYAYRQGAFLSLISQSDLALQKGKFPTPDEWFEQFKNK
jgi:hypothetical protein